eukprot:c18082_g1_i1.p1 GENE.c18082_g1_i1~~c18082_g1_i1.p1  ORF type:complete len:350 (+),score=70.72 c18082_g1_i1:38-1087(+)
MSEDEDCSDYEGILIGEEVFLLNKRTQTVFASERNGEGDRVEIGKWDPVRKKILASVPSAVPLSFETHDDDHCETSLDAYNHIAPALAAIAKVLEKSPADLAIYDPYYCQGSVKRHLATLGFSNVYNENEDFYQAIEEGRVPEHDVIVTNPPYSLDHVQRILEFCCAQNPRGVRPWFLLVPNWVYTKDYYQPIVGKSGVFYLVPKQRYQYWSPKHLRRDKKLTHTVSSLGCRTSPFVSFWHVSLAGLPSKSVRGCKEALATVTDCAVVPAVSALPDNARDSNDPLRRKKRKKQRDMQRHQTQGDEASPAKEKISKKKRKQTTDKPDGSEGDTPSPKSKKAKRKEEKKGQ